MVSTWIDRNFDSLCSEMTCQSDRTKMKGEIRRRILLWVSLAAIVVMRHPRWWETWKEAFGAGDFRTLATCNFQRAISILHMGWNCQFLLLVASWVIIPSGEKSSKRKERGGRLFHQRLRGKPKTTCEKSKRRKQRDQRMKTLLGALNLMIRCPFQKE